MDIKERFYSNLNMLREGIEKGNPNIGKLNDTRSAAKKALTHVNKNRYEEAHAAVKGTALEKNLRSHLDRAQKHWTKMNVLNNEAGKTSTSSDDYDRLRSKANDHQDQAEHHHGKAVEYLKSYSTMNEEAEQLDEKAKWRKNPRAIASKEDPHEWGNSEHDDYYGWEAPRSTGRMKAKGDTPYSDGSLMNRRKSEISTRGERKGKITKSSAARLKDRIKTNLKK